MALNFIPPSILAIAYAVLWVPLDVNHASTVSITFHPSPSNQSAAFMSEMAFSFSPTKRAEPTATQRDARRHDTIGVMIQ